MLLKRLFFLLKAIYIIETIINIYSLFHDLSHSHALFCTPNFYCSYQQWSTLLLVSGEGSGTIPFIPILVNNYLKKTD